MQETHVVFSTRFLSEPKDFNRADRTHMRLVSHVKIYRTDGVEMIFDRRITVYSTAFAAINRSYRDLPVGDP